MTMPEINYHIAEAVLALINSSPRTPTGSEIIHTIDVTHMKLGIPKAGSPAAMAEPCNPAYAAALVIYRLANQELATSHVRAIAMTWFDLAAALLKVFPELAREKL